MSSQNAKTKTENQKSWFTLNLSSKFNVIIIPCLLIVCFSFQYYMISNQKEIFANQISETKKGFKSFEFSQTQYMKSSHNSKINQLTSLLVEIAKAPIADLDFSALLQYVNIAVLDDGIAYAAYIGDDEKVLAQAGKLNETLKKQTIDIKSDDVHLGKLILGIDYSDLSERSKKIKAQSLKQITHMKTGMNRSLDNMGYILSTALFFMVLLIAISIYFLFARLVGKPLKKFTTIMRELRNQNYALEIPFLDRSDEIGDIAASLYKFQKSLESIEELEKEKTKLKDEVGIKTRLHRETLAKDFEKKVAQIIEEFGKSVTTLSMVSDLLSEDVEETEDKSEKVSQAANSASNNADNMSESANQLSEILQEVSSKMSMMTNISQSSSRQVKEAEKHLNELQQAIEAVDNILSSISGVADQTNLLAMNATIEAARAGEMGKGFAVVAGEVKALANQTQTMTEDIFGRIKIIKDSSSNVVEAMNTVFKTIADVDGSAQTVQDAVERQNQTTQIINQHIQSVSEQTNSVSQNISSILEASQRSSSSTADLKKAHVDLEKRTNDINNSVNSFLSELRA